MPPSKQVAKFFEDHSETGQLTLPRFNEWLFSQPQPINYSAVEKELINWHIRGDIALIVIDGPTYIVPLI